MQLVVSKVLSNRLELRYGKHTRRQFRQVQVQYFKWNWRSVFALTLLDRVMVMASFRCYDNPDNPDHD